MYVCRIYRQLSQTCVHLESAWQMRWTGGAESVRLHHRSWYTLTPGVAELITS